MTTEPTTQSTAGRSERAPTTLAANGWLTFAGIMFLIGGASNIIWGIAALDSKVYLNANGLLFSTFDTWGWVSIVWGAILLLASLGLFAQSPAAAMVAVGLATVSAVFWIFALPVLPIWALVMIGIDALIIYGLVGRQDWSGV